MTGEEYKKKLSELREKRDYHKHLTKKYNNEMDVLISDERLANLNCGKYVRYETKNGDHYSDYVNYLYVKNVEIIQRGFYLRGEGFEVFTDGGGFLRRIDTIRCYWDDVDNGNITTITKEEFLKAFEKAVSEFKENGLKAFEN